MGMVCYPQSHMLYKLRCLLECTYSISIEVLLVTESSELTHQIYFGSGMPWLTVPNSDLYQIDELVPSAISIGLL